MNKPDSQLLNKHIGQLFSESLNVVTPIQMLHLIREKISARGYQDFDKNDILQELGHLQSITDKLNGEMLKIYDLLNNK